MTPCTDEINRVSNAYIISMALKSSQNILTALIILFKYDLIRQGSLTVHRDNKNIRQDDQFTFGSLNVAFH